MAWDLTKLLVADTLQLLRGYVQGLQAITGLFLTAYVGLLAAIWKQANVVLDTTNAIFSFTPLVLFMLSLILLVVRAAVYRGTDIVVGDLGGATHTYEEAL